MGPTTPSCKHDGLGCSAFARRYWRNHCCFLFLWVLRWFTSPRCLRSTYGFGRGSFGINQRGFPHSDIPGSKLVCSSPGLIAAYRVLHRLLAPRHSPYALSSLTIRNSNLRRKLRTKNLELRSLRESMHTACVWSVKLPFAEYSVVKDPVAAFGDLVIWWLGELIRQFTNSPNHQFQVVENTGLEPVTSWLQTRRSPS